MSSPRARFFTASLLGSLVSAAGLLGCGGVDPTTTADMSMVATADMVALPSAVCTDPRADFSGLAVTKMSKAGAYSVKLAQQDPTSPVIGVNTWTLELADATGQPVDSAMITIKPWMPDHNHGTQVVASATPMTVSGEYQVKPLYLFMAGLWQITFTVQAGTAAADTVVFSICLADS